MKVVRGILFVAMASAISGVLWDILVWRYNFPYLALDWLGPLIGADGEDAYNALMYEMIVNFFIVYGVVWIFQRWVVGRRHHKGEQ